MRETLLVLGVVALIIAGAIVKIVRDKKKGLKCIGCPAAHLCKQNDQPHPLSTAEEKSIEKSER